MKMRTVCLAPSRAAPGMTLAAAATDHEGHVLLTAGTVIEAEMLDRLVRRGVECIVVEVVDTRDAASIAAEVASVEARIAHIFRGPGSPARQALHEAVLAFRQECAR